MARRMMRAHKIRIRAASFQDLTRPQQQRRWDREAERLAILRLTDYLVEVL
jgi:hypothetical protein